MSSYIEQLNSQQKSAVLTSSKYVRVVAGAGSGKTRVLTSRIVHLIEDLGVSSSSIVAITFTNKAANVMKQRLIDMLQDAAAGVHICFAFPMLLRLLKLLLLSKTALFVLCTVITFLVFTLVYVVIYAITAKTYYKIVH